MIANLQAFRLMAEREKALGSPWILVSPDFALRLLDEAERYERIASLTPESCKPKPKERQ